MISNWLSAALARRNIHYGWAMVAVTFLAALISAGTVGAPGVFIVPLQKEFGWSAAEISSALSIRLILFGLMAPFAAALLNRYGLRNVTLTAQLVIVSGLIASLFMTQVWQLVLLWGIVVGIGMIHPPLGMLLCLLKWQPEAVWALTGETLATRGHMIRAGYGHIEPNFLTWEWQPMGAELNEWIGIAEKRDLEFLISRMATKRVKYLPSPAP